MSDMKDMGTKTAGGIITYAATYFTTMTIQDMQAYAMIFASLATGIYYLIAACNAWRHRKKGKPK